MNVTYSEARAKTNRKPYRVCHNSKDHWFRTEKEARDKIVEIERVEGKMRGRVTDAAIDQLLQAQDILRPLGVSVITAARFYIEANRDAADNAGEDCKTLIDQFTTTVLKGRKKYVHEAKRHLTILKDSIGTLKPRVVTKDHLKPHFAQFDSPWSHDDALKFARLFFNWLVSPLMAVRSDNPAAVFEFKHPHGKKVYLSIEDARHVVKVCREHFPEILPAVGFQLFAGVRTEEIVRMEWSMVRRGTIRLPAEVAKMGEVGGREAPRTIDFWPKALNACMPQVLPISGPIVTDIKRKDERESDHHRYKNLKRDLIALCKELKPDFRWGQNAFRHSYGTYCWAFFQSDDKTAKLLGERGVDVVHNHYATYETEENGQLFFSIGAADGKLEPLPVSPHVLGMMQRLAASASGGTA